MIDGVKIKNLEVHKDNRGDFREIIKDNEGIIDKIKQVSISSTKPGIIKAFHWHKYQEDLLYVLEGEIQLVLYDPRENSPTKGKTLVILLKESHEPKVALIPKKVFHGYKVLGNKEARVLYMMNNTYNPENPDEQRVPKDDPTINFDWSEKYA